MKTSSPRSSHFIFWILLRDIDSDIDIDIDIDSDIDIDNDIGFDSSADFSLSIAHVVSRPSPRPAVLHHGYPLLYRLRRCIYRASRFHRPASQPLPQPRRRRHRPLRTSPQPQPRRSRPLLSARSARSRSSSLRTVYHLPPQAQRHSPHSS